MGPRPPSGSPPTYRAAGVDIDAADEAVRRIKPIAALTHRPEVLDGIGAFAAVCAIPRNTGLGFLLVVPREAARTARDVLEAAGERVFEVGEIRAGTRGVVQYV